MATVTGSTSNRSPQPDDRAVGAIIGLYERWGDSRYGESVTQAEHARQCGAWAMAAGADTALVAAALLHDIGHLLLGETTELAGTGAGSAADRARAARQHGERHHDLGADLLAGWFPDEVSRPVRLHVAAKRYLCATDPAYFGGLSPASVRSLTLQGGPMTTAQQAAFRAGPGWEAAVQLRQWDDRAKDPGAPAPSLDVFAEILHDVLAARA